MRILQPATAVCLALLLQLAQTGEQEKPKTTSTDKSEVSSTSATRLSSGFGLAEDTPVKLKLTRTISSKDAKVDEKVDFEVLEDVKIGDTVVIKQGGLAMATITEAHPKRRMGRSGKLNVNIDYVQLVSGDKVPLRAIKGGSGGSHTGAMTGAIIATSIVFFPAAPLFLFMHGKDITIPKGTEITAYVGADSPLDIAKFTNTPIIKSPPSSSEVDVSTLLIKADPDGADITIDNKFVGTTPSTLQIKAGDHLILIEKPGYKPWQKTLTIVPGSSINLAPTLEKILQ
jgi:hypothetical protein